MSWISQDIETMVSACSIRYSNNTIIRFSKQQSFTSHGFREHSQSVLLVKFRINFVISALSGAHAHHPTPTQIQNHKTHKYMDTPAISWLIQERFYLCWGKPSSIVEFAWYFLRGCASARARGRGCPIDFSTWFICRSIGIWNIIRATSHLNSIRGSSQTLVNGCCLPCITLRISCLSGALYDRYDRPFPQSALPYFSLIELCTIRMSKQQTKWMCSSLWAPMCVCTCSVYGNGNVRVIIFYCEANK